MGDIMNDFENEIAKHKKKKASSTSKSITKSKHKHEYVNCLFIENGKPHKADYCKICGKIGDVNFFEMIPCGNAAYRKLNDVQIFEKYKDLVQIEVDSLWNKYIPIRKDYDI